MNNPVRKQLIHYLIAGMLILLLLVCSVWSARSGIAAVHAYPAKNMLGKWSKQRLVLQQHDWHLLQSRLTQSLAYDSAVPELLTDLGNAYESAVFYSPIGDSSANTSRNFARQYYLQALSIRPGWPYSWADLARIKYMLNEIDSEFYEALQHAAMLGPWEPSVQLTVAEIGLHHWHDINEETMQLVTRMIKNGIHQLDDAKRMYKLLQRYDMLVLVCNETGLAPEIMKNCLQQLRH